MAKKISFIKTLVEKTREDNLVKTMYERLSYCMSVNDNIYPDTIDEEFKKMIGNGSGNELTSGKACAINSSSMFAYNFYHWISENTPLVLNGHIYTKVYFEVQLPTLMGSNPANMDVVLEEIHPDGKRTLLFIESKFTEHFSNAKSDMLKMSTSSYSIQSSKSYKYFPYNNTRRQKWIELISSFAIDSRMHTGYYDGIKQEICHLIALTNLKKDQLAIDYYNKLYEGKDILHPVITGDEEFFFYNVLFDPADRFKEDGRFEDYSKLYAEFQSRSSDLDGGIKSDILSYRTIFDAIPDSCSNLKVYLMKRYMRFSK